MTRLRLARGLAYGLAPWRWGWRGAWCCGGGWADAPPGMRHARPAVQGMEGLPGARRVERLRGSREGMEQT